MLTAASEFRRIHETFHPKVLRYLARLVGKSEAEDLAQIVMLKVSEGLSGFRGEASLSTWIYRIATNTALDRLRRSDCGQGLLHDEIQAVRAESEVDSDSQTCGLEARSPSAEATAISREMSACIREFVGRLPQNYKTVLALSELEGLTNAQIAEILEVSVETVKIRLHRGRERLRSALEAGCTFDRDERNELACDRKPRADAAT
ncbi:MAG: sigma-70 family RNA polymerase sigma factor [Burkholderiaceae bacterium]